MPYSHEGPYAHSQPYYAPPSNGHIDSTPTMADVNEGELDNQKYFSSNEYTKAVCIQRDSLHTSNITGNLSANMCRIFAEKRASAWE